jgi:hypothetical protein
MLFIFIIILLFVRNTYSYETISPSCHTCKWFLQGKNMDLSYCKMFQEKVNNKVMNNFAVPLRCLIENETFSIKVHCRNNEDMCGKTGIFYEPSQKITYSDFFTPEENKYYLNYLNNIAKKNIRRN